MVKKSHVIDSTEMMFLKADKSWKFYEGNKVVITFLFKRHKSIIDFLVFLLFLNSL